MKFKFISHIWNYIKRKFKRNKKQLYIELRPMIVKQHRFLNKYTLVECDDEYGFFIYLD